MNKQIEKNDSQDRETLLQQAEKTLDTRVSRRIRARTGFRAGYGDGSCGSDSDCGSNKEWQE